MAVLILILFPFLYLVQPRLAFVALVVAIVMFYQKGARPFGMSCRSESGLLRAILQISGSGGCMRRVFKSLGVLLVLSFAVGVRSAAAVPLTVVSMNGNWQQVGTDATFVLPGNNTAGCETDPACEPTGLFYFNQPWTGANFWVHISDANDATGFYDPTSISDVITFDNLGPGGVGRVQFFSGPNLTAPSGYSEFNNFPDGLTDPQTICCVGGTPLIVRFASDRDVLGFRPFNVAFDVSDGIQFQGVTAVPEPASMTLLGTGLFCAWRARRKVSRT